MPNYTLTAETGTFSRLASTETQVLRKRRLVAAGMTRDTYTLPNSNILYKRILQAKTGELAAEGEVSWIVPGRIYADQGQFVLAGQPSSLEKGYRLFAEVGEFQREHFDAELRKTYKLKADVGSFTYTRPDSRLTKLKFFSADVMEVAVEFGETEVRRGYNFPVDGGTFDLEMIPARLHKEREVKANPLSLTASISTQNRVLVRRRLVAEGMTVTIEGGQVQDHEFTGELLTPIVAGDFSFSGYADGFWTWDNVLGSWAGPDGHKPWYLAAPATMTATIDRSLSLASARPMTLDQLVVELISLGPARRSLAMQLIAEAVHLAETSQNLVDWTNLISESFALGSAGHWEASPAPHASSFALADSRRAETVVNVLRALVITEELRREAQYQRVIANNFSFSDNAHRQFEMTVKEALAFVQMLVHNAGVVLHDLTVQGRAMTLAEFKEIAASGPIGYAARETLVPGDYKYQEAIVGVSVRAAATGGISGILGLTLHVDVEDVRDRGEATLPALADQFIPFTKEFHVVPEVYTQTRSGGVPFFVDITDVTKLGMTVTLRQFSSPSTIVAGTITWSATGW